LASHFLHLQPCSGRRPREGPGSVLNPPTSASDYGNSDENIANRFVLSATYELPSRIRRTEPVVEGWQLNGILLYDGFPFSVSSSAEWATALRRERNSLEQAGTDRSQAVSGRVHSGSTRQHSPTTPRAWGNSGRNFFRVRHEDVDFSFFKNTPIYRRGKVLAITRRVLQPLTLLIQTIPELL